MTSQYLGRQTLTDICSQKWNIGSVLIGIDGGGTEGFS